MKKIILLLVFVGFLNAQDDTSKVVFDLTTSSVSKFEKSILKGIVVHKSHYSDKLEELEVSVVIHGGSYRFFVKDIKNTKFKKDKDLVKVYSDLKKRIISMYDNYEVEFLMCRAGLKKHQLEAKDIVDFVKLVPTSVIGLVDKQNDGFAYIPIRD